MTRGDIAFIDTNVLLAATDTGRPEHSAAAKVFVDYPEDGVHLAVSGQVVREYLAVATRPAEANGLGLDVAEVLENIEEIRGRTVFLDESRDTTDELIRLVAEHHVMGKRIHDAHIVATMRSHGVKYLITLNERDFSGFDEVMVVAPG